MKVFFRGRSTPFTVKADITDVQGNYLYLVDTSADEAHPFKSTSPKSRRVVAMFQLKDVDAVLYRDADDPEEETGAPRARSRR